MRTKREEWKYDPDWTEVCSDDGLAVAQNVRPSDGRRIAAVPDMERALLGLLMTGTHPKTGAEEAHSMACWDGIYAYHLSGKCADDDCVNARAALRKAGVIE